MTANLEAAPDNLLEFRLSVVIVVSADHEFGSVPAQ